MTEPARGRAWRRADARVDDPPVDDPFARLGLPTRAGLADDDVRAAWRRIAAATHPDREDGGDPARFGAAAAAYVLLRTEFGRGEALADLGLGAATDHRGRHAHRRRRSADPAAPGPGRHRARRGPPVGRPRGARLAGLTRLRDRIARRGAAHELTDARAQAPTGVTARMPGDGTARMPGDGTARMPGDGTVNWQAVVGRLRWWPRGRPGGFAVRAAGAAAVCVGAIAISGWSPGVVGILAGVLSWLLVTAGRAIGRRRSR